MKAVDSRFARELRQRIAPDKILFFLRVETRELEFPLSGLPLAYRRVAVTPGMILAVIFEKEDHLIAKWHGPTLQPEHKNSSTTPTHSRSVIFTIDIDNSHMASGSVAVVAPSEVVKLPVYVEAVLY